MISNDIGTQLAPAALTALQNAKTAFFGAQADRCGYLRIGFEPHPESGELSVAAQFTLRPNRDWHLVDASIKLSDLEASDPRAAIQAAFANLSESLATISMAERFRPQGLDG